MNPSEAMFLNYVTRIRLDTERAVEKLKEIGAAQHLARQAEADCAAALLNLNQVARALTGKL
jgi:hypothetical protein